jgi:hypothetical protein
MNWVSDFNYMVRRFFRRSKRFLELAPVIWKGEDYDSGYAIELFRTQLNRTADFLVNDSYRVDGKVQAAKIRVATELLDRVYNGYYETEPFNILERMYGNSTIEFKEIEGDKFQYTGLKWERAVDESHNDEINEVMNAMIKLSNQRQKRAEELVWKYIYHNINNWWD